MKRAAVLAWLLGLFLLIALAIYQGLGELWNSFSQVGWGILVVCLPFPAELLCSTVSWRLLLPKVQRLSLPTLLWPHWIADAVDNLLPSAQIGGDIVRARIIAWKSVPGGVAAASVIADITAGVLVEAAFAVLGVVLLALTRAPDQSRIIAAVAALMLILFTLSFYLAQRAGLFRHIAGALLRKFGGPAFATLGAHLEDIDRSVQAIYREHWRLFLLAGIWRLFGLFLSASEIWLALYFMGRPNGLIEAIILQSLGLAVRHAAFFIPGGLGVQEGGYMLLGQALGLGAEVGLTLSLVKRAREVLTGVPALLLWQYVEGHRYLRRGKVTELRRPMPR